MTRWRTLMRGLRRHRSGVAMTEFALAAPLLMTAGLYGAETANQAITQMRLNQIAVMIADHASRVGENSPLAQAQVYESDINDVLYGAHLQGGHMLDFYEHGRVILSSLEVVPGTADQQYIHWQRCMGKLRHRSSHGDAGAGLDGSLTGMGPVGQEIAAFDDEAVMFVEVAYVYQPLIAEAFTRAGTMTATAAFNVRETRDLAQVYQRDAGDPDAVASCDTYQGIADYYG
ncbi:pilus assembly protein [Altererythrobacter sp. TH136]|uniref:TadE/TadG family type IV pilus assembly protein n=1 Tax=Altererythrobacter sp. TH136 TaxID=2067415 RepID=UPI001AF00C2F|nr:pilus assembly protein [Altererythrobacter sp. TH136]